MERFGVCLLAIVASLPILIYPAKAQPRGRELYNLMGLETPLFDDRA